ncbi:MAG: cytochrome c oxidase accessory protein CcoG, partial [Thiotrichales bacterium]|nr:cytochrome c oxidase accessory protein CcoG [Thiotrichales bacterium]
WPQDFLLLTFLLMLAALSLFFFTTLAGRLWCGYACPQTVWTEVFLWVERMIEGDRIAQMRLDKSPMSLTKLRIKATKHAIWILFSLHTGATFIGYFTPIRELTGDIMALQLGPWATFWLLFYGFATYGNAGWMREQVCKYMCPYARFQSAMFDRDTMIVSYDKSRGEPRGKRRFGDPEKRSQLGDCINCTMCVQVCPTGIDIRDGLQYECIGCSACIDVCDDVMQKVGYAPGLIRYTTQNRLDGQPSRIIRPRVIIYGLILLVLVSVFIGIVATRIPLELDVIRDRNQLYRETQGLIENVYKLKIINMDEYNHTYILSVDGIKGLKMELEHPDIYVKSGKVLDLPVRLRASEDELTQRSTDIEFTIVSSDNPDLMVTEHARFIGPSP